MFYRICYKILKFFVCGFHQIYYQRIEITGLENIPENAPIIFAPNHQNAIMDALILVCTLEKPVLFMARGDFFNSRIINYFLRFLHIIPIYRKSEGFENISKNAESFQFALKELQNGGYVCIMPEAGHQGVRYIRSLSNGIFRIAFSAQQHNANKSVFILPVGIFYTSYSSYCSSIFVSFGESIRIKKFIQEQKYSDKIVINSMKHELYEKMKVNIINIQCGEYYDFINKLSSFAPYLSKYANPGMNLTWQVSQMKKFTSYCNVLFKNNQQALLKGYEQYKFYINEIDFWSNYPEIIMDKKFNHKRLVTDTIWAIAFAPLSVLILSIYAVPLIIPELINRYISDKQFHSSIQFVFLFFMIPFWIFIIFILWLNISHYLILTLISIVLACYSFKFVFPIIRYYKQLYLQYKAIKKKRILMEQIIHIFDFLGYKIENNVAKN